MRWYPNCGAPRSWQLLTHLSSVINIQKTTVVPSSEIEFLGFTLNTKTSSCNQDEWNPIRCPSEQNGVFEGALPASGQVSSHKASSVQGTITLSSAPAFESFNDEVWIEGDYNSTGSPERPDMVAHTIANASLLPYCPGGGINSHRIRCSIIELRCQLWRNENERVWNVSEAHCHINLLDRRQPTWLSSVFWRRDQEWMC